MSEFWFSLNRLKLHLCLQLYPRFQALVYHGFIVTASIQSPYYTSWLALICPKPTSFDIFTMLKCVFPPIPKANNSLKGIFVNPEVPNLLSLLPLVTHTSKPKLVFKIWISSDI